jgi:hypothetical protein
VGELPVQGAESDLLLVRGLAADGLGDREYVVKIFRRGYGADRQVWQKLPSLDSAHVVRILETGHADGRDYEVIEYAPAGNLRALMTSGVAVSEVLSQLAAGLGCLHRSGIVHRDLKPENVLVTGSRPLRLAITDFGLSKVIDQSVIFASSSRTLAYAAPESLSGQVSPARDWWSLGMMVRELVTGRPPFLGMSETAVVDHLATRPMDNADVPDPRLRLLCQGLLTRDPRRRWGGAEVAQWLDGGSPTVAAEPAAEPPVPSGPGLPFAGRRYSDRAELARALVEDWDTAARYFFGRGQGGEAWRSLRDWLGGFEDDSRIALIDTHLTGDLPPDVKLLHLVRWLDPELPPHYLGRRMEPEDLSGLVGLAMDPSHADHRTACVIGRSLWDHDLLPVLAGFAGASGLADIGMRWRGRAEAWNDLAGWLRSRLPPPVAARLPRAGAAGQDDPPIVLLTMLALSVRPAETARALADAAARARDSVREPVPWFRWLTDGGSDDPLRLFAVVRSAPEAVTEVEAQRRERHTTQEQAAARHRHWEETERRRLAGRGAAIRRALLWSSPILGIWLFGSWLLRQFFSGGDTGTQAVGGFQRSGGIPLGVLLMLSVLAWGIEAASEVFVAGQQGEHYLPFGPWSWLSRILGASGRGLSSVSESISGTAQRRGRRGCGFLMIAGILPLLLVLLLVSALVALVWAVWALMLVALPSGHAIGAGIRLHRWRQVHEQARREALGAAT